MYVDNCQMEKTKFREYSHIRMIDIEYSKLCFMPYLVVSVHFKA